jgi:hypothetical protein
MIVHNIGQCGGERFSDQHFPLIQCHHARPMRSLEWRTCQVVALLLITVITLSILTRLTWIQRLCGVSCARELCPPSLMGANVSPTRSRIGCTLVLYAPANLRLLAPRTAGASAAPISFLPNWQTTAPTSEFCGDEHLHVTVLAVDDRMVACCDALHAASENSVEAYLFPMLRRRQQLEAVHGEVAEVLESDRYAGA